MADGTDFDGSEALKVVEALAADIGPRFAGTSAEKRAADYLGSLFAEMGYSPIAQQFPLDLYEVSDANLEVEALGNIPCEGLLGCPDCPDGVEGKLVYVEGGEQCALPENVTGAVLLLFGELSLNVYPALMRASPMGIIVTEGNLFTPPRRHNIRHEMRKRYGSVPCVRIGFPDGKRLMEARGRNVSIRMRSRHVESTATNVMADLPGSDRLHEIVVVCAHFDSVVESQGALDNAGGTGVVMELARVFRRRGSRRTLRFITFSGEEQGLRGSIHYARELRNKDRQDKQAAWQLPIGFETELERHRLCVNVDVQGAQIGRNAVWISGPADLAAATRLLAAEHGPYFDTHEACYSSDNAPFGDAGVPTISFGRGGPENAYGHTLKDEFALCSSEGLATTGEFLTRWLERYVTTPRMFPFERAIPDEHKKQIADYFKDRLNYPLDDTVNA